MKPMIVKRIARGKMELRRAAVWAAVLAAALFAGGLAHAQTNVSGSIFEDTTWTLAGSPYNVTGNVLVQPTVTLTIEPGVVVNFSSDRALIVSGTLVARGTAEQQITFTSGGIWAYIRFNDSAVDASLTVDRTYVGGSILEHCIIEKGGNQTAAANNGAVQCVQALPFIDNCIFRNNQDRPLIITPTNGTFTVRDSVFTGNNVGSSTAGVEVASGSGIAMNTEILGCEFSGNTGSYVIVLADTGSAASRRLIQDTVISDNTCTSYVVYSYLPTDMINCFVERNTGSRILALGNYSLIEDSVIDRNQVTGTDWLVNMPGIGNSTPSTVIIRDSRISNNVGSIFMSYGAAFQRNLMLNNTGNVVIQSLVTDPVRGNVFIGNRPASGNGGALSLPFPYGNSVISKVEDNLFLDNQTVGQGGGLYIEGSGPTVARNIFSGNRADIGGAIYARTNPVSGGSTHYPGSYSQLSILGSRARFGSAIEYAAAESNWRSGPRTVLLDRLLLDSNQATEFSVASTIRFFGNVQSAFSGAHTYTLSNSNFLRDTDSLYMFSYNVTSFYPEFIATGNYWGTTSPSVVDQRVFDVLDDASTQAVNFFPILTAPSPLPPVSPVQNVSVTPGAPGSFTVSWDANPEPDIDGYFVYVWSGAQEEEYFYVLEEAGRIADAGDATSTVLSGLGGGVHYFSVTAYDGDYDELNEDPLTPVLENMTAGYESFFSEPVPGSGEPNEPPVLDAIGDQETEYDTLLEFTVTATDPNLADVLTLDVEGLPEGAAFDAETGVFSWTPAEEDAGAYELTFTVTDLFGPESDSETITLTVLGPDVDGPVITLEGGGSINVPCGEPFEDPGAVALDAREGDVSGSIVVGGDTVVTSAPNVYILTYDAEDSLGNPAETASRVVNVVDSVPPVVTVLGANPLVVPVFTEFSEPGFSAFDACEGDLLGSVTVLGLDELDTDTPGLYTLTYRATDSGNNTGQATRTVSVVNSDPVLAPIGDKTVTAGSLLAFTVSATDPNAGDTLTLTSSVLPGDAAFTPSGEGTADFSWTPTNADVGGYEVTFTATDAADAQSSENITITVEPDSANAVFGTVRETGTGNPLPGVLVSLDEQAGPYTDAIESDANGNYLLEGPAGGGASDVSFTLATYQTRTVTGVIAPRRLDVNLTSTIPAAPTGLDGRAAVGGNLLRWNANTETDLAGYNVYVSEEGGPFTKINAEPVEDLEFIHGGLTPGTLYAYEITAVDTDDNESPRSASVDVEAGRIEIFVPRVSAPAGTEVRIPINVNNAAGINPQGMDIDFRYPSALLGGDGVSGVRLERTALTKQVVPLANATEAGRVRVSSIGEAQTLVGEGHIFNLYLTLSDDAAGLCDPMELFNVKFFDSSVPPVALDVDFSTAGDLCGDVACMQGDLNGDFEVDSADVLIALQTSVGLLELTACQLQAGDINGDRVINSADGIMIQRLAVGFPINPPQPGEKQAEEIRAPKGSTLQVTADAAAGAAGSLVQVPVRVANATGLTGLDLTVAFPGDPSQLTLESVSNGALLAGFSRIQNIGPGFVKLGFSSALPIIGQGGIAAVLNFRVSSSATDASVFPVTLNEARVNGQFGDNFAWTQSVVRSGGSVTVGESEASPAAAALAQFPALDTGDGTIGPEEALLAGIDAGLFEALDADESGTLSVHELIEGAGADAPIHRADSNADGSLGLAELLRVIQLYNAGGYKCDSQGEDGYRLDDDKDLKALDPACLAHSADYLGGGSGAIELSELLRQIQFYNVGGYAFCKGTTEDNFCPED